MQNRKTEEEFLQNYNSDDYASPLLSVDSVLFTIHDQHLQVLLVNRSQHPFKRHWGLPGGFINIDEDNSTQETASKKITEKTQVIPPYLEQLQTFSSRDRDPRGWSATVAYFALISHSDTAEHLVDKTDVRWVNYEDLASEKSKCLPLAFDHLDIINIALHRLRQKALYSMLPVFCLPKEFTLGQYHNVMEIILDKKIQKKSLYRRFDASEMFEETGKTIATGARAAMLYRLKNGVELINFERNLG